jgi:hypothetical protein
LRCTMSWLANKVDCRFTVFLPLQDLGGPAPRAVCALMSSNVMIMKQKGGCRRFGGHAGRGDAAMGEGRGCPDGRGGASRVQDAWDETVATRSGAIWKFRIAALRGQNFLGEGARGLRTRPPSHESSLRARGMGCELRRTGHAEGPLFLVILPAFPAFSAVSGGRRAGLVGR